jgi:NitT/TauT family transport system ATP-binding protein
MAGLVAAERGVVEFVRPEDRRRIALIPQDYGLFPWKTVRANALMGIEIKSGRRARPEERTRVRELLAELGIGSLADRWPATLSGGQKQRTAIARALAVEPALLLMDEPFSALDADIREDLQDLVRSLPARHGTTPVLVTHDIAEALRVADRLILFRPAHGDLLAPDAVASGQGERRFVVDSLLNDTSRRDDLALLLRAALRASRNREGGDHD